MSRLVSPERRAELRIIRRDDPGHRFHGGVVDQMLNTLDYMEAELTRLRERLADAERPDPRHPVERALALFQAARFTGPRGERYTVTRSPVPPSVGFAYGSFEL